MALVTYVRRRLSRAVLVFALLAVTILGIATAAAASPAAIPVEPDGGIGGEVVLPVEPDGGGGEVILPVEPDGGIGN